ncbi:hypothetical protein DR999_PMT23094 [Platysternon megacephalum]|uniref:Uncharacterized protein n=1 Tax=Platysternon megacephalum TaxID=55544 RepID=A0A4D9DCU9_9SAUR|nr:hypothetical protein DR999_PMT23094 [Platysternon megacephalum]
MAGTRARFSALPLCISALSRKWTNTMYVCMWEETALLGKSHSGTSSGSPGAGFFHYRSCALILNGILPHPVPGVRASAVALSQCNSVQWGFGKYSPTTGL